MKSTAQPSRGHFWIDTNFFLIRFQLYFNLILIYIYLMVYDFLLLISFNLLN